MHNLAPVRRFNGIEEKFIWSLRLAYTLWEMTRMNLVNILLAQSSEQPCPDGRSHNFKSILETSALGSHLRVHDVCLDRLHTFPYEPDLVVLKFGSSPVGWKDLIKRLQGWKAANLIGAFCGNTGSREITQSFCRLTQMFRAGSALWCKS
jgi:hypothetical protein